MKRRGREYWTVALVVTVAAIIGLTVVSSKTPLNIHYPEKLVALEDADFRLTLGDHTFQVGQTPGETIMNALPQGKMLGLSTIYSVDQSRLLFTFTENENIWHKIHIETPQLITARGSRVGDAFAAVKSRYGESYAWVDAGSEDDYDAVYGSDNNRCIVFQVRQGLVQRIILQNDP